MGTSADTPEFAVDAVKNWWLENRSKYKNATELLILADSGGSNGCRSRVYKKLLQEVISDGFGLKVTVCHYPTGTSKWNPVEHKLFGPISNNWAGVPLESIKLMLGVIRDTSTNAGLSVSAKYAKKKYKKGRKASDSEMADLNMTHHDTCPKWNYTFMPRRL